jgi:hypothetical protein
MTIKYADIDILYVEEFNFFNFYNLFVELKLYQLFLKKDDRIIDILHYNTDNIDNDLIKKSGFPIPLYLNYNYKLYLESPTNYIFNNHNEYKNIVESEYNCNYIDSLPEKQSKCKELLNNETVFALRKIKTNSDKYIHIIVAYDSEIINLESLIYLIKFIFIE